MTDPLTKSLKALTSYFHKENIEYVFVGGIAVIIMGRVRTTMDLEVIINHKMLDVEHFVKYLQENGFSAYISDFIGFEEETHVNVFLRDGMFRIDIKGTYTDKDRLAIENAIDTKFNEIEMKVNHPLNTVAYKLYVGTEQDYEDALAVFIRNEEKIQINQLRNLCSDLGVEARLDEFLNEISEFKNGIGE